MEFTQEDFDKIRMVLEQHANSKGTKEPCSYQEPPDVQGPPAQDIPGIFGSPRIPKVKAEGTGSGDDWFPDIELPGKYKHVRMK